ncbi:MAG: hypothetical protein HQ521_04120 [Bacteroidetes bacterium]|nr:hypothetical protein [Bacteroidota bacterium]
MPKLRKAVTNMDKIVDHFDSVYTSIKDNNTFLKNIRYYSVLRLTLRLLANVLIPLYYALTYNSINAKIHVTNKSNNRIIVSLTTFPLRINKIWIVIESIMRQTHKPDLIILWLSKDQFASVENLPKKVKRLRQKGLEIRFCDGDIKSHKKYFYTIKEYPEDFLLTIDDDIIYPTILISQLVELNEIYPKAVCCLLALSIQTHGEQILPFMKWKPIKQFASPSFNTFFGSGGGTLFPPSSLHQEVLNDTVFKKLCLFADDVWLNCMCQLNDTMIVKSAYNSDCLPILYIRNQTLASINMVNNENDVQIQALRTFFNEAYKLDKNKLFLRKDLA